MGIPRSVSVDSEDGGGGLGGFGGGDISHSVLGAGAGSSIEGGGTVPSPVSISHSAAAAAGGGIGVAGTIGVDGAGNSSIDLASRMTGFSGIGKYASIVVEPATGTLLPGETITLTVTCQGGTTPQRVRGSLRCSVTSTMKEVDPMPPQLLSYRCEVQAPKTVM